MEDFGQKILEKIKDAGVSPMPKRVFMLKRLLFWVLAALFMAVGVLASAALWFVLLSNDWDVRSRVAASTVMFILKTAPYFWLVFLAFFVILTIFNYRHTKFGYRAPLIYLIVGYIVITVAAGGLLHYFGFGNVIEDWTAQRVPGYYRLNYHRGMWLEAERGLLAGEIKSVKDNELRLIDGARHDWRVFTADATGKESAIKGERVKVTGQLLGIGEFNAAVIRPWSERNIFFMHKIKNNK